MTKGVEIRAQIDTENVKGLVIVNGGAAVALLALLPAILNKPEYEPLLRAVLWSLLVYQFGLVFAIAHNRLRRVCSLVYEQHNYQPPPCKFFGRMLKEPCVCQRSIISMWLSVIAFSVGGLVVFAGGLYSLEHHTALKTVTRTIERAKISAHTAVDNGARKKAVLPSR